MTVAEIRCERVLLLERGDTVGAGYADEFLREVEADFAGCETPDLLDDDRDQENPSEYSENYDWDGHNWGNDPDWR